MDDHMSDMKELGHGDWAAGGYSVGTYGIVAVARIAELEAALAAVVDEYDSGNCGLVIYSIDNHARAALKG
jgi:hypothetical protein